MSRTFLFLITAFISLTSIASHAQSLGSIWLPGRPVPMPTAKEASVLEWNQSQPGFSSLPSAAQEYLYWVNFCRANPSKFWDKVIAPVLKQFPDLEGEDARSLQKDLQAAGSLPMFMLNRSLIRAAQAHADDIAGKAAPLSHTSTDGTDFNTRMKRIGIRYCAAENIALSTDSPLLAVILLYLDIGLPEKGHRKALLDRTLTETGLGSATYGSDKDFFVQDMACAQR